MRIQQSALYVGDSWWQWAVWLDGTQDELDAVEYVEWRLHATFPDPVRRVDDRATNFRLETGGWGTFPVHALVQLKSKTSLRLHHDLELRYPDDTPAQA